MKRIIQWSLFIITIYSGCSEFNSPFHPIVTLNRTEEDTATGSGVWLYEDDGLVAFSYFGEIYDDYATLNARFYLKERREGEYRSGDLSSLPADFVAEIYFRKSFDSTGIETYARMMTMKRNGKGFDTAVSKQQFQAACIILPPEVLGNMPLYFWQIEFYFPHDTLRLPEKPGIWFFE